VSCCTRAILALGVETLTPITETETVLDPNRATLLAAIKNTQAVTIAAAVTTMTQIICRANARISIKSTLWH